MAEGVGAVPGAKSDMEVTGALANDAKTYIDAGKTNGWIHTIAPGSYADECLDISRVTRNSRSRRETDLLILG